MRRRLNHARIMCGAVALAICAAAPAETAVSPSEALPIVEAGIAAQDVPACSSCHGVHGEGLPAHGAPRLARIDAGYLERQLAAFAGGQRRNAVMGPIARALTPHQRTTLATYFAALPRVATAGPVDIVPLPRGRELAVTGDGSRDVPSCDACHGPNGEGVGSVTPPLVGQTQAYLLGQLIAFRSGERSGLIGLMNGVASRLTLSDLGAAAAYYASLPLPFSAGKAWTEPAHPVPESSSSATFASPPDSAIPDDPFGREVAIGRKLFTDTGAAAPQFVGNDLKCSNCHLDAGRRANSAPLWAAYVLFPQYRTKNGRVITFQERLQGCFEYSMNGKAPPLGDPVLVALESYTVFLSKGAPMGMKLPGGGYPVVAPPQLRPDRSRGQQVYVAQCALCHGEDGSGQEARGTTVFPPLWGDRSFNWGAGMADIDKAARFIKANMPFSQGGRLTDQQAWDVAAFVDGKPRPQDPRYAGSVEQTRARFHDTAQSLYGTTVDGVLLGGDGPPKPFAGDATGMTHSQDDVESPH